MEEKKHIADAKIEMQKIFIKVVFVFVAFLGASASTMMGGTINFDPSVSKVLMFVLSQVQFFLSLLILGIGCYINLQSAYIRIIEEKINNQIGEKLLLWDSEVNLCYVRSHKGVFFWITCCLGMAIFVVYLYFVNEARYTGIFDSFWLGVLMMAEITISIVFILLTLLEPVRVYRALIPMSVNRVQKARPPRFRNSTVKDLNKGVIK